MMENKKQVSKEDVEKLKKKYQTLCEKSQKAGEEYERAMLDYMASPEMEEAKERILKEYPQVLFKGCNIIWPDGTLNKKNLPTVMYDWLEREKDLAFVISPKLEDAKKEILKEYPQVLFKRYEIIWPKGTVDKKNLHKDVESWLEDKEFLASLITPEMEAVKKRILVRYPQTQFDKVNIIWAKGVVNRKNLPKHLAHWLKAEKESDPLFKKAIATIVDTYPNTRIEGYSIIWSEEVPNKDALPTDIRCWLGRIEFLRAEILNVKERILEMHPKIKFEGYNIIWDKTRENRKHLPKNIAAWLNNNESLEKISYNMIENNSFLPPNKNIFI